MAQTATIFELGLDNHMNRMGFADPSPSAATALTASGGGGGGGIGATANTQPGSIRQESFSGGEQAQIVSVGKTSFTDTTQGKYEGLDVDGLYKWIIGDGTDSIDWGVTTASTLTVSGTITASTIIGSDLHVPDQDTTANSWHVGSTGNMWIGATETSFTADNENAQVYFLADGTGFLKNSLQVGVSGGNNISIDGANQRIRSSNYVTGTNGAGFTLEPTLLEVGNIAARGVLRSAVFEKDVVSVVGGNLLVTPGDVLSTAMTALDASTLTIEGNETFSVGDILRIKNGADDEWLEVTGVGAAPTYSVTRDLAGSYAADTNPAWAAGAAVTNYRQSGDGLIYMTSSDTNAPYIQIIDHAGAPQTTVTERVRLGNLTGITDAVLGALSGYGLYTANGYFTGAIVANSGRIGGTTNYWDITSGSLAAVGAGDVEIRGGQTAYNTGVGFWLGLESGTAKLSIGDPAGDNITWDGSTLSVAGNVQMNASDGTISLTQNAATGSSLAVTRDLASGSTDSTVVSFIQDNAGDDQAVLSVRQDGTGDGLTVQMVGAGRGIFINQDGDNYGIEIDTETTTFDGIRIDADALTTGSIARFYSNSNDASTRNLVEIINDHADADNAACLYIQQDADDQSIDIASLAASRVTVRVVANSSTTANILDITGDGLTTGGIARFYSNSSSTGTRNLVEIINDNSLATGTSLLYLNQDASAGRSVLIDHEGNASDALEIQADNLTTGSIARFYSQSSSSSTRSLVEIINDSSAADTTTCLFIQQDADQEGIRIESNDNAAHIRFTGDPTNTTPSDGDLWYDGSDLKFYDGTEEQKVSDVWYEIGETTLGSAGATISVTGLATRQDLRIVVAIVGYSADDFPEMRFNNDSGNNYITQRSTNGAAASASATVDALELGDSNTGGFTNREESLHVVDVMNRSASRKIVSFQTTTSGASGATLSITEGGGQWNNTSAQISRVDVVSALGNNFSIGSRCTVYAKRD